MIRTDEISPSASPIVVDEKLARVLGYLQVLNGVGLGSVVVVDGNGVFTYASPSISKITGFREDEILASRLEDYLHPMEVAVVEGRIAQAREGKCGPIETMRFKSVSGDWRFVDVAARKAHGAETKEVVLGINDVTERVQALQELRDTDLELRRAQRVARIASWSLNLTTDRVSASRQLNRMYGLPESADLTFAMLSKRFHPDDVSEVEEALALSRRTFEALEISHRIITTGGDERMISLHGEVELVGHDLVLYGTAQDVTRLHRLQRKVQRSESRLRKLMGKINVAQEDERKRLAREIHDVLGQAMTAIRMDVSYIKKQISPDQKELRGRVAETLVLVEDTIQTVRQISHDLRPSVLDHFGLAAALDWQTDEFSKRADLKCTFEDQTGTTDLNLDPDLEIGLFRIYQEALTNVVRHAKATCVETCLRIHEGYLTLQIVDNGKGIDVKMEDRPASLGLLNMKERVMPWKGKVVISGKPNEGTVVSVSVLYD